MKKIIKQVIKQLVDPLLLKIERRNEYLRKENLETRKVIIIANFQSAGFGVCLDGENWNFRKPKHIVLGNNVHIGDNAYFHGEGGLIIGDNTHISRNVTIYTVNHDYSGDALPYDFNKIYKPVLIENNVWIGMNVSISPGVLIGEGAIIGIGTIVNRDIEPFEIVGSPKTNSLKYRSFEHYKNLNASKNYGGINGMLLKKKDIDTFLPSYEKNRNKPIIFVLGTGRSGSTSIVDILNQHPSCKAFHEDIRQLIRISTLMANEKDKNEKYYQEIKDIFKTKIWNSSDSQVLIHSDQRLWNLIPFLSNFFPNSKFIHLIREPISCIKSMIARDWYQIDEFPKYNDQGWAKYRIQGDEIGEFSTEDWNKLDQKQKCIWYWMYINQSIARDIDLLPKDRRFLMKLENISTDIKTISNFFEIPKFEFNVLISNKRKKVHDDSYNQINKENIDLFISEELSKYNSSFY